MTPELLARALALRTAKAMTDGERKLPSDQWAELCWREFMEEAEEVMERRMGNE